MNKALTNREARDILMMIEKAYRRGFQHGHHVASTYDDPPTKEDVFAYRYNTTLSVPFRPPVRAGDKHNGILGDAGIDGLMMRLYAECLGDRETADNINKALAGELREGAAG
jgi:hypothetical protein